MPTSEFIEDVNDEFVWTSILTEYDDDNVITSIRTVFDSGITRTKGFAEGTLDFVLYQDLDPTGGPSDARPWDTTRVEFNMEGEVTARLQLRDDGSSVDRYFEDGVLRQLTKLDSGVERGTSSTKPWERIDTFFDETGQKERSFRLDDDGVTTEQFFADGVIQASFQEDRGFEDGVSDARNWTTIETYYDANGDRELRFELKDNGISIETQYEAGQIRLVTQLDGGLLIDPEEFDPEIFDPENGQFGIKPWQSIQTAYGPEGQIDTRQTVFDDGDVTFVFFESGVRSVQVQLDADDSQSWLIREVVFDASGNVEDVNNYKTEEDVPEEYAFLIYTDGGGIDVIG